MPRAQPLRSGSAVDAEAVAELLTAAEAAEPTGERYRTEDVREELTAPNVRLAEGSVSVWEGSPREAANPGHRMRVELLVHPAFRDADIGARLADWCARTAPVLYASIHPERRSSFTPACTKADGGSPERRRRTGSGVAGHSRQCEQSWIPCRRVGSARLPCGSRRSTNAATTRPGSR
jgi:hypothetical protein